MLGTNCSCRKCASPSSNFFKDGSHHIPCRRTAMHAFLLREIRTGALMLSFCRSTAVALCVGTKVLRRCEHATRCKQTVAAQCSSDAPLRKNRKWITAVPSASELPSFRTQGAHWTRALVLARVAEHAEQNKQTVVHRAVQRPPDVVVVVRTSDNGRTGRLSGQRLS